MARLIIKNGYQQHEEHISFIINRVLKGLYEKEIQKRRNREEQKDKGSKKKTTTIGVNDSHKSSI